MQPYRTTMSEARQRRRLTQGEVARCCGISRSAYQKYEYGQRNPTLRMQRKLIRVLNLPWDLFLEEEDARER